MNKPVRYEAFDVKGRLYSTGLLGLEIGDTTLAEDVKGLLSIGLLGPGDSTVEVWSKNSLLAADELIGGREIKLKIKRAL